VEKLSVHSLYCRISALKIFQSFRRPLFEIGVVGNGSVQKTKVHEEPWMVGIGDAQTIFVEGFAAWADSRV
jgi:hypothetical protein